MHAPEPWPNSTWRLQQAAELTDVPILIDVVLDEKDIPSVIRHTIGRTAPEAVRADYRTAAATHCVSWAATAPRSTRIVQVICAILIIH